MKFLVVDDDEIDLEMMVKALRIITTDIDKAKTGAESLCLLEKNIYDLIILDYKLPDCDGTYLINEIKKVPNHPPIIIVTGFGNEELVKLTYILGVLDYIPKDKISPEFLTRTALNALKIYKTQLEKKNLELELVLRKKKEVDTLNKIIEMAQQKIAEYDK